MSAILSGDGRSLHDSISEFESVPLLRQEARRDRATGSALLRRSLRLADGAALVAAWALTSALWPAAPDAALLERLAFGVLPMVVVGCWLITTHQLYLARVAAMRTVEQARIASVCALLAAACALTDQLRVDEVLPGRVLGGAFLSFVGLSAARTAYRGWLSSARRSGQFTRPVVIVGIDAQTAEICKVLAEQTELGFEVVGVLGERDDARRAGLEHLWGGELEAVGSIVTERSVTGAIVSSTALDPTTLNAVTRLLLKQRCHVHLSTGISGIDQRRLRPVHLGYEPLLYLEPLELTPVQLRVKRLLDLTISTVVAVLVAPVLAVSALAIKLEDRGPVLFRQQRVGRDGDLFTVIKLRTMAVGAEDHLDALLPYNERNGPLFKMQHDPRVTRVGKLLRDLSIDELPQLWNVLRGDMSLVGPRPALPTEARAFGARLRSRTQVLPGVTGLWQVEARDSESFDTYERLDLFYVENWSVGLDIMVMVATIENELAKVVRRLVDRPRRLLRA
jgi:exopolysaccharide biosynthesis polyprenyl glycosylphosphotransferase